jgi:RNA polymerase sigma factor (sigma-70 family)
MNNTVKGQTGEFIPTRYSLLSRLHDWDDQESWRDFFDTYWRLIYSIALKAGLTDAEAQDVVQETVMCVARDIDKFKRDRQLGSFKGWLRNLTRWRIADQLRKRSPNPVEPKNPSNGDSSVLEPGEMPEPVNSELEQIWEAEWHSNLMDAALERVRRRVKEEHYQIFDLNVVRQWPATRVAKTLEVSVARVYLTKHRLLALLKKEVRMLADRW